MSANGRVQLKAWSPAKAAGGAFRAAEAAFKTSVRDAHLRLQFDAVGGPALVAAIVVTPARRSSSLPLPRIA